MNAIFNTTINLNGAPIYIYSEKGYPPCPDCMKSIIQVGIKEIILLNINKENTKKYNWPPTFKMINMAKIKLRTLNTINKFINI